VRDRAIANAIVFSVGVAGVAVGHFGARASREDDAAILSAVGRLDVVELQFHRESGAFFLPVYEDLLVELDPATRVLVVVEDERDIELFERIRAAREVEYVRVGEPITSWARDRLTVLAADDHAVLVAPPAPHRGGLARANDWLVPWTVRRHLTSEAEIRTAPFAFDGGDLIADESHVFIAAPLLARNPQLSRAELVDLVEATVRKPAVYLGDEGPVPDHHIGMFVTPLGGGRVAYGDADVALASIDRDDSELRDGNGLPIDVARDEETLERFRNVGRALERHGFEAVPIPLLPTREPFVFLSYNNVLLDRRGGRLHVFLPRYGVPSLDRAAARAWAEAGARVHPIEASTIYRLGGSVRCVTAPLVQPEV
jgi:hypothetical protein